MLLYHDEQLQTFSRIQRAADGVVDVTSDVEDYEAQESSEEEEEY